MPYIKKPGSLYLVLIFTALISSSLTARSLNLSPHLTKDSLSVRREKSHYKFRLKLSLPDTLIEIKNDTIEKNGKTVGLLKNIHSSRGKKERMNPSLRRPPKEYLNTEAENDNSILINIPLSMQGSGTSWQPESSAPPYLIFNSSNWSFYFRGAVFPRYTHQAGKRGSSLWDAPDWIMGQAQTDLGQDNQLAIRAILSAERITEGGNGYPLLFQTGSVYNSIPSVDRQHPDDFISELSAAFSGKITRNSSFYIYFGYPGEPAVGPPAFYSRQSAKYIPDAPIGLQWQDASRVSFGVVTLGMVYNNIKLEGSVFNGSQPDGNSYGFDKPKLNSYGGRISYNPVPTLSFQLSSGNIKDPYELGNRIIRTTASAIYNTRLNNNAAWASSFIWGENNQNLIGRSESFLSESTLDFSAFAVYARAEFVQKTDGELGITKNLNQKFWLGEFTLGIAKKFLLPDNLDLAFGAQGTLYGIPDNLTAYYGDRLASYEIYFSLQPQAL